MFDGKIQQLIEAGLTSKYFQDEMDKEARKAKSKSQTIIWQPLGIYHLQGPLMLFPILLSFSLLSFCLEFATFNRQKYNK